MIEISKRERAIDVREGARANERNLRDDGKIRDAVLETDGNGPTRRSSEIFANEIGGPEPGPAR